MAINIRNVLELLQQKEHEVTSSDSTDDLIALFRAAKKGAGAVIRSYDSDGALPDATTTTERIAFSEAAGELRFNNNGQWDYIVSGTEIPPAEIDYGPYSFQGTNYGYVTKAGSMDRYPFASDADGGSLVTTDTTVGSKAGHSSQFDGYVSTFASIEKWPFRSEVVVSSIGGLAVDQFGAAGAVTSQSSETNGYISGGYNPPATPLNTIQKFSFTNQANATDIGDLTVARGHAGGSSAPDFGYGFTGGGQTNPSSVNTIDKFAYASDGNAVDHGDLSSARQWVTANSSATHGYVQGGAISPPINYQLTIDKYPFASNSNATSIGNLLDIGSLNKSSQSSTTHGYVTGQDDTIQKYSFSSNGNATDVANLTTSYQNGSGHQY